MKKVFLITGAILSLAFSQANAQTVFIPNSTSGIDFTTNPSTENVGIGTDTPSANLEIAGYNHSPSIIKQSATLRLNAFTSPSPAYSTGLEMGYHSSPGTFTETFSIKNSIYPACGSNTVRLSNGSTSIVYYGTRIGIGLSPVSCSGSGTYGDITMGFTGVKELLVGNEYAPMSGVQTLQSGYKLGVNGNAYVTGTLTLGAKVSTFTQGFPAGYSLYVSDGIMAEKLKVAVKTTADWADYVFAKDYQLKSLEDVETFINQNNHLPDVPSAQDVVNGGIDVAKMDALLLQKIEELTLYMIELKKQNEALNAEIIQLKK